MSTLVYPLSPLRFGLPHYCHSKPVRRLAWQSVPPSLRPAPLLSLRASDRRHWRGNPFPRPRAAGASPLFTFASGGHLSFNSERKVRKNATKTYGFGFPQRAAPCREFASCFSRSRFSRVPLSVKRAVPPQLSADAACCHGSSLYLYRRDGERAINGILAAQRAAPTPAAAPTAAGARFDNRPPHRERVSKGRGRARPFPLDASRGWDF